MTSSSEIYVLKVDIIEHSGGIESISREKILAENHFNYKDFITSLENLQKLKTPLKVGYTHFGVVNGQDNVSYMMEEHKEFLKDFRSKVVQYYEEKPETKYI